MLVRNALAFAFCLVGVGLSGCATGPCDATTGDQGFLKTANCELGGGYALQTSQMTLELDEKKELNEQLRNVLNALDSEASEVRAETRAKRVEYEKLNTAMQPLLASLEAKSAENKQLEAKVASLRSDLADLNAGGGGETVLEKRQRLDKLKTQMLLLEEELGLGADLGNGV